MSQDILVVDDEVGIRELLSEILEDEGYRVRLAENASAARQLREAKKPDLVLLDIWMPDTDGISLLKEWAVHGLLNMPVVMMSGHATIDTAVEATRIGAVDFLEKPIALPKLLSTVQGALLKGKQRFQEDIQFEQLGRTGIMLDIKKKLDIVMDRPAPVLFVGEDGVGAEFAARYLHGAGAWLAPQDFAWLVENPYAILADVEQGTLFLHDIARLDRPAQRGLSQLLSKLERHKVRLIAASSLSPATLLSEGGFDVELLGRLSQILISLPALREHADDIPDIAETFLKQFVSHQEVPPAQWGAGALNELKRFAWPGNLTSLSNAVRTLALTSVAGQITQDAVIKIAEQYSLPVKGTPLPIEYELPLREARDRFEQAYLEHHIRKEAGNMSRVAEKVGLERTHLYRKLKQLGVKPGGRDEAT